MLKQESNWTQVCNTCRSAACTVYCRADSAYLCTRCDAEVHAANLLASRHERVRVCESCERAPAASFCKADAASLCITCDSQIHSANPLATRNQRVPILPVSVESYSSMATNHSSETTKTTGSANIVVVGQEEEVASWLLPSSGKNSGNNNNVFSIGDEFLDLVDYKQDYNVPQKRYVGDGVVPLQVEESKAHMHHEQHNFHLSQRPVTRQYTAIDQQPDPPSQILSPVDREARVLRYREKKKTRKFEKTVRYASRKAYAETRPRINGRFVKMKEVDAKADQAFSTMVMFDTGHGVVPSF
ncbi:hypothetical protein N665_0483s0032 [Sinapis alba]|nr:hypothetical protein N665_0483s0032 [Sinapis alba]